MTWSTVGKSLAQPRRKGFRDGAIAAASIADDYNASTSHGHRLGDCILAKLNLRSAKPRKNNQRADDPRDAFLRGVAVALGEVYNDVGATAVRRVAHFSGLTLKIARAAGTLPHDLRALKRAGVK